MPVTTADEEFAALMAASSLRAPRVRALGGAIPDSARRQLHAAAVADPATGTHGEHTADGPDEEPDVCGDGDDGEHTCSDDDAGHAAAADGPAALHGLPAIDSLFPAHASADVTSRVRYEDVIRVLDVSGAFLRAGIPWHSMRDPLAEPRMRDLRSFDWHIMSTPPRSATGTSGPEACVLVPDGTSPGWSGPSRLIAHVALVITGGAATAPWVGPPWAAGLLVAGPAESGAARPPEGAWDLLARHRHHPLAAHATQCRSSGLPHLLSTERPADALFPSMGWLTDRLPLSSTGWLIDPLPSPDTAPWYGVVVDQSSLLVAGDPVVDLDPAHRHAIPVPLPPLPDLDAYAPRPGGSLLLPKRSTDGPAGSGPEERHHTAGEPTGRTRLWRRKDSDGLEQHAQFWMRLHREEGDKGQRFQIRLIYRTADPYAVTAVFNQGTDEETEWVFARELLVDGLHESAGIGDVVVSPSVDETSGRQRIFVRLRSPEGTALLSASRHDIEAFLDASHPLTQNPVAISASRALDAWERELTEIICPGQGE
ncbi:SsgA family sporulation/cell division regulator [Streptomyces sp. SP2-10]|uniref:SsgA family sporulation/cell division regulator n=1 Tax=Streptomyces sp. SP2-10 TaxID=2873385 RepID=UPI001CA64CD8|nr:SsgA family sporulation/cell division regulator [Streptomyces sp. SP2-10]MBY8845377.1 SsgA family sporulation/cell division regulator [Streptomyces sp. SP2-10]